VFPRAPAGSNGWIRAGSSRGLRSASESDPSRTARPCARRAEQRASGRAHSPGVSFPYSASGTGQRPMPGLPRPAQAASSGFLSPLTPCSARDPAGPVSYRLRSWGFPFRGFPFQAPGTSRCLLPLLASLSTVADGPRPSPVRFRIAVKSVSPSEERDRRHARMWSFPDAPSGVRARPGSPYSG
jgi:hypothetical protein